MMYISVFTSLGRVRDYVSLRLEAGQYLELGWTETIVDLPQVQILISFRKEYLHGVKLATRHAVPINGPPIEIAEILK